MEYRECAQLILLIVNTIVSQRVIRDDVFKVETNFMGITYTRCADPRHEHYLLCTFLAVKSLLRAQSSVTVLLDIYPKNLDFIPEQWRLDVKISDRQLEIASVQALLDQITSLGAFLPTFSAKPSYRLLLSKSPEVGRPSQCSPILDGELDFLQNKARSESIQFRDVNNIILQMFYKGE